MYNKELKDRLHVLRIREPRPPFSEMVHLVANAPARSIAAVPLYAKFAGALAITGVVTAGAWVLSAKFHAVTEPAKNNLVNAGASYLPRESRVSDVAHESYGSLSPKFAHAKSNEPTLTPFTEPEGSVVHSADDNNAIPLIHASAIREQLSSIQPIPTYTSPSPIIANPSSGQTTMGSFFATLGGAISQQFGAPYQQTSFTDAFLGVGYNFSPNSSVRILAGEEVFSAPSSTTTNSIAFRDTTFVQNGQSYTNVFGIIQSVDPPALMRVYWLGASYRYTMGDLSNPIRPFAELMAGGSTDGFLTHQSIGAEFSAASNIDLDLLFEASELITQNSSWLTKAGFSAAVSYRW